LTKKELGLTKFTTIEPEDIELIRIYIQKYQFWTCDYNAANLFSWSAFMNVRWGMYKDRMLFYNYNSQFMLYPLGEPFSVAELHSMSKMMENEGFKGNFISVPEEYVEKDRSIIDDFEVVYDPCNSDYLYITEKLAALKGRKLHKKKNLVSQFRRNYPGYKVEVFRKEHIGSCLDLADKWSADQSEVPDEGKMLELQVMERALNNCTKIGLEGLLLFHDRKLIAFSLFSGQREDMATVHFEKFDYDYKGSAQVINQETALFLKDRFKYLNREQDVGLEGLRKAKLSYEPYKLIPTYQLISK